jgi:hypothetical protein
MRNKHQQQQTSERSSDIHAVTLVPHATMRRAHASPRQRNNNSDHHRVTEAPPSWMMLTAVDAVRRSTRLQIITARYLSRSHRTPLLLLVVSL